MENADAQVFRRFDVTRVAGRLELDARDDHPGGAQATPCSIWYAPETQLPSTLGLTDTPLAPADVESSAFIVSGGSCVWIPSRPRAIRWPTIS